MAIGSDPVRTPSKSCSTRKHDVRRSGFPNLVVAYNIEQWMTTCFSVQWQWSAVVVISPTTSSFSEVSSNLSALQLLSFDLCTSAAIFQTHFFYRIFPHLDCNLFVAPNLSVPRLQSFRRTSAAIFGSLHLGRNLFIAPLLLNLSAL